VFGNKTSLINRRVELKFGKNNGLMMVEALIDSGASNSFLVLNSLELCKIQKKNSTTYHPMGNGMVERLVKSLKLLSLIY
jgi:hypothetical protein